MKKILLAVPLLAGAAFAGTSHYAGTRTENEYQQLLQQLNDLLPMVFVNETYTTGLSRSTAITNVMTDSSASAEVLFRLHHDIQHSPVHMDGDGLKLGTVSIVTTWHANTALPANAQSSLSGESPMTLISHVTLDGQINNSLIVDGADMSEQGETYTWSGMSMDMVTVNNATVGSGSLGSVSYADENVGGKLSIKDSQFAINVQAQGGNIFTGTGDLTLSNISAMNPAAMAEPVSIDSISLNSSTDREGDAVNGQSSLSINGIVSPLPLNNASLDVEVDGILMEGLRQYNTLIQALGAGSDIAMADEELVTKVGEAVSAMFEPGSAIKSTLALDNDAGDVNADIRIGVKEAAARGMSADALDNIVTGRDLLDVLAVNGQLNADTAALAQTPVMMMLGGVGEFMTIGDESITSSVELEGTTLVINGVEMPLEMMAGDMLDAPLQELLQK